MNFKKTLSLVLAVLMVITAVPFSGLASDATCEHEYVYSYYKNDKHIRECSKCTDVMEFENCSGGEATCGQQAVCDFCKTGYGETPAHKFTEEAAEDKYIATEGDCQTEKTYYKSCAVCGASSKDTEFEATFEGTEVGDHVWSEGTSNDDATCTEDGTKDVYCTVDGCDEEKTVDDEGSANGHSFTEEIKDEAHIAQVGTCTKKMKYYYDCAYCNANAKDEENASEYVYEGDTLPHMFVEHANLITPKEPGKDDLKTERTCTTLAVFYKVCYECETSAKGIDEDETYEFGDFADHEYINFVDLKNEAKYRIAEVTCTDAAIYAKSCKACGLSALDGKDATDPTVEIYIEGEEIPEGKTANAFRYGSPLRHSKTTVTKEAKEPTCTADGNTEEITCEYCKIVLTESQKLDKLGHDCDLENPAQKYQAPTCKQYGTIGKVECARCKSTFAINEKNELMSIENIGSFNIEPLGHIDADGDEICDRPSCGSFVTPEDTCECIACNGTGIMYFIGFILKWIWSLLGINQYCECGAAHY